MNIQELESRCGVTKQNIRFYERKGLLTPAREADSKYRDYSQEDVQRMKQILLYRKMVHPSSGSVQFPIYRIYAVPLFFTIIVSVCGFFAGICPGLAQSEPFCVYMIVLLI